MAMMLTTPTPLDDPATSLGRWLWEVVCKIEENAKAPKFRDYALPLLFLKRLNDVYDDEIVDIAKEVGDHTEARRLVESDHRLVRFFIPPESRWSRLSTLTNSVGEALTDAMRGVARTNPQTQGVVDAVDYNAMSAGKRILDDHRLTTIIGAISDPEHRLGLVNAPGETFGQAFENLLRRYAEGRWEGAGEAYTPPTVARLMVALLDPQPGMSVYDPCCGAAGLLVGCQLHLLRRLGAEHDGRLALPPSLAPLSLTGQELLPSTYSVAFMNAIVHDVDVELYRGDTMAQPATLDASGRLRRFDLVTTDPRWNQPVPERVYRGDQFERFNAGIPPPEKADWGWVQHMLASLAPQGRLVIVFDTGAASRGSGSDGRDRERQIRKIMVEEDLVEATILLPENLFYKNAAPGLIMVLNRAKPHPRELLAIDASDLFKKGRPKNSLDDADIDRIVQFYREWRTETRVSAVITSQQVLENDYNLSPSRYVAGPSTGEAITMAEAVAQLKAAEVDRAEADKELWRVLGEVGLE